METRQWMTIPVDEFEALHEKIRGLTIRSQMVDQAATRIAELEAQVERLEILLLEARDALDRSD